MSTPVLEPVRRKSAAITTHAQKSTRRKPAAIAGPAQVQPETPSKQQGKSKTIHDDKGAQQGDPTTPPPTPHEITAAPTKSSQYGFPCQVASAVSVAVVATITALYLSS